MANQNIPAVRVKSSADPITIIGRSELAVSQKVAGNTTNPLDYGPDLQNPSHPLAPMGLAAKLDDAIGNVRLPKLLELADALEHSLAEIDATSDLDPEMSTVVLAVLSDEKRKVLRYLDLRDK